MANRFALTNASELFSNKHIVLLFVNFMKLGLKTPSLQCAIYICGSTAKDRMDRIKLIHEASMKPLSLSSKFFVSYDKINL